MNYCKECGASLSSGTKFCKECGTPAPIAALNKSAANPKQPSKPLSPKVKKLLIAGILLVGLFFGAYKTGEALTGKERKIEKFETALIEKNQKELANVLVSTDKKLKINSDSLNGLMRYLDENPDEISNIVNTLKEQAKYYNSVKSDSQLGQQYSEGAMPRGIINLEKGEGSFPYDEFYISIQPIYMSLSTNYKDTILMVNGQKISTADTNDFSKKVGPYVPGIYTVEANLKNDYVTLKNKQEIYLMGSETQQVNLYLEGEEITLDSNYTDSGITGKTLLNGKDIGVDPFSGASFGPVVTDGSLLIQAIGNFPWGETNSAEIAIEDNWVEFNFAQDDAFQKSIIDTVVLHAQERIQAYTAGDATKMSTATAEQKEKLASEILSDKENGRFFTGSYLGSTFNLDSFEFSHDDEQWIASVSVKETYNSDYYYEGDKPELSEDIHFLSYDLVFDEEMKKWLVSDSSSSWGFNEKNVKEIKETEPKQYTTAWKK
ncbi:zinc ribbon domain-containing protein [Bacillus sp. B-jedd]|uniref:zinc ribbon domain-containing protein n=1 Tax=Bacillus sp. B-jedd TaxID=1476857 RepID=UPI000515664D|nr:zinc ribbon domain-containing protein [Bacillus sp. B-jedd]CEG29119.1 Membrane-associated protein tcaA [Bacillus sp. B-jedd]